ncbi:MAG: aminotransferase class I/II-fold pyridoxal phosphate-dependent enzyme [Chloroflexi bacterium]|nr:aminotransferase class I/II-fold pyridoxal phosphate-dependent enzyme [Chloroflexota bacterium]
MAKESIIRSMTRLANEYGAVNLSQGFTDEAPEFDMVWGAIAALIGGTGKGIEQLSNISLRDILSRMQKDGSDLLDTKLKDILRAVRNPQDAYNQYSYPFGLPELRQAISDYTDRFQHFRPDVETEITVVAGATEGAFSCLAALCRRGDEIIIIQPYHEMYLAQAMVLGLSPKYVTLREDTKTKTWNLDLDELEGAIGNRTRVLILNTPHNPTGKVFTSKELEGIADICRRHDVVPVTDEIYEHFLYNGHKHISIATLDGMRDRTITINAITKTGHATGWRVGWVISPTKYTPEIRGVHDTLVIQSPTPLQKGAERLLRLGDDFFSSIATRYQEKRRLLLEALEQVGFVVSPPEGSYYIFANYEGVPALKDLPAMDAAIYLMKDFGVASVPGSNFYATGGFGDKYLRFAFCKNTNTLKDAAAKLRKLCTARVAR